MVGQNGPDDESMYSHPDIVLTDADGNPFSGLEYLNKKAVHAPGCVFGEEPFEWVPSALAYADARSSKGTAATADLLDEAARVITSTTDLGDDYSDALHIIVSSNRYMSHWCDYFVMRPKTAISQTFVYSA